MPTGDEKWREELTSSGLIRPNARIRLFIREGHPDNKIIHTRAVVDEEWIVFRYWSNTKRQWRYRLEWSYAFWLWMQQGWLTDMGDDKS